MRWLAVIGWMAACGSGDPDAPPPASCDPSRLNWSSEAPGLPDPREAMAGAEVDGTLWLVGGWSPPGSLHDGVITTDGEVWLTGPSLPEARQHLAALALDDGLIVAGGDDGEAHEEAWQLDGEAWRPVDPLPAPATFAAGASDGTHGWVVGGLVDNQPSDTVYRWTGEGWTTDTPLPGARWGAAARVEDGRLVVYGGASSPNRAEATVWSAAIAEDGALESWQAEPPLPEGRALHSVTAVGEERIVVGGFGGGFTPSASAWLRAADGTHTALPDLPGTRFSHVAWRPDAETLWLVGGWESFDDGVWDDVLTADLCP